MTMQTPMQPWELIQLGNCGSPIATPEGRLVLTHGGRTHAQLRDRRPALGTSLIDLPQLLDQMAKCRTAVSASLPRRLLPVCTG